MKIDDYTLMLTRTFDVEWVNKLVNDPEIRPFVGGEGVLDMADILSRPEHIFLRGEHGGFALGWSSPRSYEVHTFILKSGRGSWARAAAAAGIEIAKECGATQLWTRICDGMPHVDAFARAMGMKPTGQLIKTWGKSYHVLEMVI